MLEGAEDNVNDENKPPLKPSSSLHHWRPYIPSLQLASISKEAHEGTVISSDINEDNKDKKESREIYTVFHETQDQASIDLLKGGGLAAKLTSRFLPRSLSTTESIIGDASLELHHKDSKIHSPHTSAKHSISDTPLLKTPSPDQQITSSINRVSRRRFHIGGGGGAQRVKLGPPIRVSDPSADFDVNGELYTDKSKDEDDSFEQPPTIRARPPKSILSLAPSLTSVPNSLLRRASSMSLEDRLGDTPIVEMMNEPKILSDMSLSGKTSFNIQPDSNVKDIVPLANSKITDAILSHSTAPVNDPVTTPEEEDDDMIVDCTTMRTSSPMISTHHEKFPTASIMRSRTSAADPKTPKHVQLSIPNSPKGIDFPPRPPHRSYSSSSTPPGSALPNFGSNRHVMAINTPASIKPIKLYNPAGAMTPKAGIEVNYVSYRKIGLIGRGGSSKVYKIMNSDGELFALKKVNVRGLDPDAIEDYLNEIALLQKLTNNSRIIRLYDSQVNLDKGVILMVLEYGEIDLAHLLNRDQEKLSENFIRLYWEEMLEAVNSLHAENVIHSDLKPANFLMVQGALKLIDFGIAKHIPNDTTNIHRDHQTGTLNYMSPEAITYDTSPGKKLSLKLGRSSDVWSLGCILYQFAYGRTPFSHLPMMTKLQSIVDPNQPIYYAPINDGALLDAIKGCLKRNPKERMTIPELLQHPFLHPHNLANLPIELTPRVIQEILEAVNKVRSLQPLTLDRAAQLLFNQAKAGVKLDLANPDRIIN